MEYYYTDGQINVVDDVAKRSNGKKVDYLLLYKPNYPIAVIEAKDRKSTHNPVQGCSKVWGMPEIYKFHLLILQMGMHSLSMTC